MPNPGDLVPSTEGGWMVYPPARCPNGHQLGPGQVVVSHRPCGVHGGHQVWRCETCGGVIDAPDSSGGCDSQGAAPASAGRAIQSPA